MVQAGHDAVHVDAIDLTTADDEAILGHAADHDQVVVTADADFGALLALHDRTAPSVVLLRSADHLTPDGQADLILASLDHVSDDLQQGAVVTCAPGRIRVRSLPVHER